MQTHGLLGNKDIGAGMESAQIPVFWSNLLGDWQGVAGDGLDGVSYKVPSGRPPGDDDQGQRKKSCCGTTRIN